jgi:sugar lactone lactonase YvrE
VANAGSGNIAEFTANGTLITSNYATGLSTPKGLAFDSAGNLYVANTGAGTVTEILPGLTDLAGGAQSTFASNLHSPTGLAFDSAGNLFVTNQTTNSITVITPGGIPAGNVTITGPQLHAPYGIAFDSAGHIFVVNQGKPSVEEIKAGGIGSIFVSGGTPRGDTFDSAGNLYVTDASNGTVTEYNALGGVVATYSTNGCDPTFITDPPGFLPVPEPSTYALLFASMGLILYMGRRKMARAQSVNVPQS